MQNGFSLLIRDLYGVDWLKKNRESKISCYCPFNHHFPEVLWPTDVLFTHEPQHVKYDTSIFTKFQTLGDDKNKYFRCSFKMATSNPYCFIATTKAAARGWKDPRLPYTPAHCAVCTALWTFTVKMNRISSWFFHRGSIWRCWLATKYQLCKRKKIIGSA
jgi:hypothetical protein